MNIFLHELKCYRKSTIIWTCSLAVIILMFLSIYPAFANDVDATRKMLAGLPEQLRNVVGLSLDNFFTILGYYSYTFSYILLCGSIQAMNFGTSVVSKEVHDKTADFLLSKPISRIKIITSKILAILTLLLITNIIYAILAYITASVFARNLFDTKVFFMMSATLFFVQLIFMSLGILVSVIFPKIKSVIAVSLSTVFGFLFVDILGAVIGDNAIRYFNPFKSYDYNYIIQNSSYETKFIIIEILFIVLSITASYIIYRNKDVHSV